MAMQVQYTANTSRQNLGMTYDATAPTAPRQLLMDYNASGSPEPRKLELSYSVTRAVPGFSMDYEATSSVRHLGMQYASLRLIPELFLQYSAGPDLPELEMDYFVTRQDTPILQFGSETIGTVPRTYRDTRGLAPWIADGYIQDNGDGTYDTTLTQGAPLEPGWILSPDQIIYGTRRFFAFYRLTRMPFYFGEFEQIDDFLPAGFWFNWNWGARFVSAAPEARAEAKVASGPTAWDALKGRA